MSIFVWIETFGGQVNPSSWEALGAGQALAQDLATDLHVLVFGSSAAAIAREAEQYGAAKALVCADQSAADYHPEIYAALLTHLVQAHQPAAVIATASSRSRELLATAAADVDSGLISDVIDLRLAGGKITGTRPAFAGKVLMEMQANSPTAFITLRGRAFQPPPKNAESSGAAIEISTVAAILDPAQLGIQIEGFAPETGTVNLSDAAIVVSGGRGMANNPAAAPPELSGDAATIWKAQEGFANTIQPLATLLGAAMGASRAAVDAGYIPYEHQVGQTGKVVNPDLYIACGISGAIQHQAGMRGSKIIVAINKDAQAPIFKLARYGIVGDLYELVPALAQALKEKLG